MPLFRDVKQSNGTTTTLKVGAYHHSVGLNRDGKMSLGIRQANLVCLLNISLVYIGCSWNQAYGC